MLNAQASRTGLVAASAAAVVLMLGACSNGSAKVASAGSTASRAAAPASPSPSVSLFDLPRSDRSPVPGEVCTMTYAPTGYGGTVMSITLAQRGDLIMQVVGPDGPVRDDDRGAYAGSDNGVVFNLPPEKITALSAQLILADGTTHDCSAEPFRP